MTEKMKKKQTKAGATELSEKELEKAQGGFSWGETNVSDSFTKKTTESFKAGADLSKK